MKQKKALRLMLRQKKQITHALKEVHMIEAGKIPATSLDAMLTKLCPPKIIFSQTWRHRGFRSIRTRAFYFIDKRREATIYDI